MSRVDRGRLGVIVQAEAEEAKEGEDDGLLKQRERTRRLDEKTTRGFMLAVGEQASCVLGAMRDLVRGGREGGGRSIIMGRRIA